MSFDHRKPRPRPTSGNAGEKNVPDNLLCGRNTLRELLAGERDIDKIFIARGEPDMGLIRLLDTAREKHIPIVSVERARLEELAGTTAHQGVVISVASAVYSTVDDMLALARERGEKPLIILCDGIEDPHNLGAIIRSAECTGAHGVIISKRRATGLTAVVAKASAGALTCLPVARVPNLACALDDLKEKGLWAYACDMKGEPYYSVDMTGPSVLVLGNEGEGISRLLREKCDFTVSIPMRGRVDSLNVSNAAAVILCEASRQRHPE